MPNSSRAIAQTRGDRDLCVGAAAREAGQLAARLTRVCLLQDKLSEAQCLSSQQTTRNARSAASPCTRLRSAWPEDSSGTKCASSAVCAPSCWTPPTARSTRVSCSARCATRASSGLRATASAGAPAACPWTPGTTSRTRIERRSRRRRRAAAARTPRERTTTVL